MKKNLIPLNFKKNILLPKIGNNTTSQEKKNSEKITNKISSLPPMQKEVIIQSLPDIPIKENITEDIVSKPDEPKDKRKVPKRITKEELEKKKEFGQYYTTDISLQETATNFIRNKPNRILEPSVGKGDLILPIIKKYPKAKYDLYEIDSTLESKVEGVKHCNFLTQPITESYKTIIGNPPFVKTKKGNLAIDFVRKCFGLLEPNGELIFIVPADFFKLTSTANLINEMMELGTFTDIYHPTDENLFANASINVMLFRYCKNSDLKDICKYNGINKKIINNNGLLIFVDELEKNIKTFEDYINIYVGMVSGRDEIYKVPIGNIDVLIAKDTKEKFIYSKVFPTNIKVIDEHLEKNKAELLERKIRKFNEDNWHEWGAPRNVSIMESQKGKKCIYIYNLTRKDEIAFEGLVDYFGGNLIILIPRDAINLNKVIDYLNSDDFKKNYIYGGRFKIGHRQLCNALLKIS